ncbi:MAG: transporter substrate-binding domain-containing protein [Dysgonamonadaceae bacterium]|jgi:membrane-bound lytic murein transglycosylase MltF|nr:transporter substrate-binding domain-containing protein [Dysgonamonadaceae bacterium]
MKTPKHYAWIAVSSAVLFLLLYAAYAMRAKPLPVRDFHDIEKERTIRIVTEYGANSYYVSADSIDGFQYELAKALGAHFGWQVTFFLENNLAHSIHGLKMQTYDLIARNIPVTTENREDLLFTDLILLDRQILVQRTESSNRGVPPVRNQIELGKKTLYVPENSPGILRLKNLSEEIADTIYILEEKQYAAEQLIFMVARGDIDFAVVDYQTALKYQQYYPELDIDTDIGFTQMQSWAVRKESPLLLDSVNAWLKVFKTGKEFAAMKKKY